jgi:hypothetical protein
MDGVPTLPVFYQTLKQHVDALDALLSNPAPASWSWLTRVGIEVKAIADMYVGTETM